jgi:hypothetical protein
MSASTWLAGDSVEAIRAQLDPLFASSGWSVSFSDHAPVQWIAPVAEKLKHHSYPFIVPSVDWFSGDPQRLEMTDFDAKLQGTASVFDLMAWLARQALDARMHDRRAIVAAKGAAGGGRGELVIGFDGVSADWIRRGQLGMTVSYTNRYGRESASRCGLFCILVGVLDWTGSVVGREGAGREYAESPQNRGRRCGLR